MAYQHLAPFDPTRDFICQTFFRCAGVAFERNQPFDKSLIDPRLLATLYSTHKIGYADATAKEDEASVAPATIADLGDDSWAVGAPWMDEPETVKGRDQALWRAAKVRDAGEPDDHHGVVVVDTGNGWWGVKAAWADEAEKVHGEDAARKRATELRDAGPPAGWGDDSLVGSDAFEATYEIGGATVQLGDLVAAAQAASGHEAKVWNAMEAAQRDGLIQAELDARLKAAAGPAKDPPALKAGDVVKVDHEGSALHGRVGTINAIGDDGAEVHSFEGENLLTDTVPLTALSITEREPRNPGEGDHGQADLTGGAGASADTALSDEDRITALVDGNTEAVLRTMADGLDGLGAAKTKAEIAKLIVAAGRDVKAGPGGAA